MLQSYAQYWLICIKSLLFLVLAACSSNNTPPISQNDLVHNVSERWKTIESATYTVDIETYYATQNIDISLNSEGKCTFSPVGNQLHCTTSNTVDGNVHSESFSLDGISSFFLADNNNLWFRWLDVSVNPASIQNEFAPVFASNWQKIPWSQSDDELQNLLQLLPVQSQEATSTDFAYNTAKKLYTLKTMHSAPTNESIFWLQNPMYTETILDVQDVTYLPERIEWKITTSHATLDTQVTTIRLTLETVESSYSNLPNPLQ